MEPLLSENAKLVLEKRYLSQDPLGNVVETPKEMFQRVARAVASIEKKEKQKWEKRFFKFMTALKFLPNSPTLMNAGKPHGQLSACYVLPIEDSLDGIFETLKYAAKIHQSGGGTGFSFSRLRSSGSQVKTSRGIASGPVSFMKIYDETTEIIKQGGVRRGANMAVLRIDHPDIFEFINSKRDQKSICNFNISVGATEDFMCALMNDKSFILKEPSTRKAIKEVKATELFDNIVQSAWECGDPGLVFLDRINLFNPTPKCGEIESTNPCGEQPLLPYESCNLGSLNVSAYVKENGFDWDGFYDDIKIAVRFLDNVIDINFFPITKSKKITLKNRKIGLGVMGFADALLLQKIPYDSESAVCFGEKLMSFLDHVAKLASHELAKQKGRFPNWKGSLWDRLGYPYLRNATVSTVAPTGTISMIAGCSSGIEPIFSDIYYKNVLSGEKLLEVHQVGEGWKPAWEVSVESHIKMQAVFQRFSDSAVSKTVNLHERATTEDVKKAYILAYEMGCKGITVYRDKSRLKQVLEMPEVCSNC